MARGDFPFDRLGLKIRAIVARPLVRAEVVPLRDQKAKRPDMQIKETPDVSFPGAVESPSLEDAAVLASSAGVSFGVQRAFSATVRSVHDESSGGVIASRCVEIPLVGRDGEISGVPFRSAPR